MIRAEYRAGFGWPGSAPPQWLEDQFERPVQRDVDREDHKPEDGRSAGHLELDVADCRHRRILSAPVISDSDTNAESIFQSNRSTLHFATGGHQTELQLRSGTSGDTQDIVHLKIVMVQCNGISAKRCGQHSAAEVAAR